MNPILVRLILISALSLSGGHAIAAVEAQASTANPLEEDWSESSLEVPIESIQQFVQIYGTVKDNYVTEKTDEKLFLQAIQGLVAGLDRYSRYLSAEDYQQLLKYTEADLASVDFDLEYDDIRGLWSIETLRTGGDSVKLGLSNGMSVYKIDGQELRHLNRSQVHDLLTGSIGSTMLLQISPNSTPLSLVRNQKLDIADIEPQLLNNQVLVLKVKVFQQDTASEIKRYIDEAHSQHLKAVLIDLRNNPGGLLSAAVETADLFLNQGVIVSTKSRSEGDQQFQALPGNEFANLKLGVLTNQRSASAAEVFTGAMKDHRRAVIVGEKSYGKGLVQKLFPLENGAAIQMTVSHYFTPNGQEIDGKGIQPNIEYPWPHDMNEDDYLHHVADLILKSRF